MTIKDGPGCVGNGILLIVAFRQNGIKRGNGTAAGSAIACALNQLRQLGKNRGRIPLGRRWFANGQGDLPLCLGVAGERIH